MPLLPDSKIVVFIGPPGAGKGTQTELLGKSRSYKSLIAGDILRAEASKSTQFGQRLNKIISEGKLIPDEIVLEVLEKAIEEKDGVSPVLILDGFPRTIGQAEGLEEMLIRKGKQLNKVFYFHIKPETAIERNSNRRYCPVCKKVYNLRTDEPAKKGVCKICGCKLVTREDDKPEIIRDRLSVYEKQTKPLLDFYRKKSLLVEVDGEKAKNELMRDLEHELDD
ncbi:nucleoside monophosphate kinase [candidate division WOR-3 bacterium]|nr:nucleoside monophosphate kinase [candidate division WOR-3 bacterium]